MNLIEFIFKVFAYPGILIGTVIGIFGAFFAWWLLPETIDRASIGGWLVMIGFFVGLIYSYTARLKK